MPKIKDLPLDERPREKLLKYGADKLSDAELLTILISSGTKEKSALELGADLLKKYGSFRGIAFIQKRADGREDIGKVAIAIWKGKSRMRE